MYYYLNIPWLSVILSTFSHLFLHASLNFLHVRQNKVTNEIEKTAQLQIALIINSQYLLPPSHVSTISYPHRRRLSHVFLFYLRRCFGSHARRRSSDNNYYRQITDRIHLSRPGELTKQRRGERRERQTGWEWETTAVIWPPVIGYIVPMNWYVINIDWLRAAELASSSVELKGWARPRGDERGGNRFPTMRQSSTGSERRERDVHARGRTMCPMRAKEGEHGEEERERGRERGCEPDAAAPWCMRYPATHNASEPRNAIRSSQLVFGWRLFWSAAPANISMNNIATLLTRQRVQRDRAGCSDTTRYFRETICFCSDKIRSNNESVLMCTEI